MKINEINGMNNVQSMQQSRNQETDSESRSFQNQITNAQNQLQQLSANSEMSSDEKAKKRQEIQKQIVELNNQLRQHQIELRREQQEKLADREKMLAEQQSKSNDREQVLAEQQEKSSGIEEIPAGQQEDTTVEDNELTTGLSSKRMEAMVSANSAMEQVRAQENISMELESRVRVLEGQINMDTGRGAKAEAKKSELESLENKVTKVSGVKMNILSEAVQKMKQTISEDEQKDSKSRETNNNESKEPVNNLSVFTTKNKTDIYAKGKMFSEVDIHI